jgi:hypothetical protein
MIHYSSYPVIFATGGISIYTYIINIYIYILSFDYYYYNKEDGPIYKSIEALDKTGINLIEKHDPVYIYS